jgi:hypothetical protein
MARLPVTLSINSGILAREYLSLTHSNQSSLIGNEINEESLGRPSRLIQSTIEIGHGPHGLNQLIK